jgi:hypothetical protein
MKMDCVLAKIKGLRKKPFFKMLSGQTLFETLMIDLDFCVPYDPDHNLDEDAWFMVEDFKRRSFCIDFLKSDFDSKDWDELKREQFPKISYLLSSQGDDFYFQKINPALFISRKTIYFGEAAELERNENRLVVNDRPDAIYFKRKDALVFRNLAAIASIFKGIDALFKEATQAEVANFLGESFLSLGGGYDANLVSKPNRKRIGLAMTTLEKMSAQDRSEMCAYINDYCKEHLKLDEKTKKFQISKDEELKLLLYGIEQRFYTTPFGKEKRLANSVQAVG